MLKVLSVATFVPKRVGTMRASSFPGLGGPMRVLVCDDNTDAADTLAFALRMHGHDVKAFYDGQTCLHQALDWKPAVAFLDIGMPHTTGYDVARQLRASLGASILLVAVTAYNSSEAQKRALEAGFDMHLPKPAMLDQIVAIVGQQRPRSNAD